MNDIQRRFRLPVDLSKAADFHTAYMNWPTEPDDGDTRGLASYGEHVASEAEDAVKSRDARIEELEEQVADLESSLAAKDQEIAALTARIEELENRP